MYGDDRAGLEAYREDQAETEADVPALGVRDWVLGARTGSLDIEAEVRRIDRRIDAAEEINSFLWRPPRGIDGTRARVGGASFLRGLPIGIKDNIDIAGIPTTSGSIADLGRIPERDAPVWKRLKDAGAVLAGKTHMSEFAYRSHHPEFGRVANPRRLDRASGGSSSGSAAAVAADLGGCLC